MTRRDFAPPRYVLALRSTAKFFTLDRTQPMFGDVDAACTYTSARKAARDAEMLRTLAGISTEILDEQTAQRRALLSRRIATPSQQSQASEEVVPSRLGSALTTRDTIFLPSRS
jgi:hypothetical protein